MPAVELLASYRARERSPVEVLDEVAARIEALNAELCAFTALCLDRAREEARAAERAYREGGETQRLLGVPFAAKDTFDSEGVRTAYGSPMFADNVPGAD